MNWLAGIALAIFGLMLFGMIVWKCATRIRKQAGSFFLVIAAGLLYCMATKPPTSFDSVLADNGTHYTNNYAKIVFKWKKTVAAIPNSTPLTISRKANGGTTWETAATSTVGAGSYELAIASTNFSWYIWCDYIPPTPVHTNGVWLGQILEKPKDCTGVDKLLVINGQMLDNGKVIAP